MHGSTTRTLDGDDVDHGGPVSPKGFSFIRAAAGFVVEDAPPGGVFTAPEPEPTITPVATLLEPMEGVESVERVDLPPMVAPKPPSTPVAHRLMVVALIPFVIVAISGIIVINRPSTRRVQPAPAPAPAAPVPTTAAPLQPPPAPPTTATSVVTTRVPQVPTTQAPRGVTTLTPTTVAPTTQPPATTPAEKTPTTEAPPTTVPDTTPPTTAPPTTTSTTTPTTTATTTPAADPNPKLTEEP